jgi:two-component system, OmpR family, sensor histidine kinase KdpD
LITKIRLDARCARPAATAKEGADRERTRRQAGRRLAPLTDGIYVQSPLKFSIMQRELRGIPVALLLIAVTTVVLLLARQYLGILRGSVLYLLPVMIAGYQLGVIPALVTAVAGVVLSGYIYFAPLHSFKVASPTEALNLVLFMVVAVVISHLSSQAKRHTTIARKREREMSDLYAFSRRLAAAQNASEIFIGIQNHLSNLVQRRVVLLGAAETGNTDDVPERVRTQVACVEQNQGTGRIVEDNGSMWLIRQVSPKTPDFGSIAIDLGNVSGEALADMRGHIDDALADAAATLERLDVARALNEVKMRSETELLREALIGSVSHELRTPLSSILGAATVLANAPTLASDRRLLALVGVVRDEAERLNSDIQNLLDATTISRQQVRPKPQWVEPVDLVNAAIEHRRRRLAGHPVTLDLDANLPIVRADPAQLEQALMQILDNAAKYSPDGAPIQVTAHPIAQAVVLSVHDSGAGLTDEEKSQVGERFFRGPRHAVTTSGSGLGLWIANAFVTANGGRLEVDSEGADRGTTVSLHLPVSPEPKSAEQMLTEPLSAEPTLVEATASQPISGWAMSPERKPVEPAALEASLDE